MQRENSCPGCLSSCDREIQAKRISDISQRFLKGVEYQANLAKTTKNHLWPEKVT